MAVDEPQVYEGTGPVNADVAHAVTLGQPELPLSPAQVLSMAADVRRTREAADADSHEATVAAAALAEQTLHDWLRRSASDGIHMAGTCRMGAPNDPMAVVDYQGERCCAPAAATARSTARARDPPCVPFPPSCSAPEPDSCAHACAFARASCS